MQRVRAAETLDGGDRAAGDGADLAGAGVHRLTVDQHHTTAALLQTAAVARALEVQMVAQHVEQGRGFGWRHGHGGTVDGECDGHWIPPWIDAGRCAYC